MRAEQTRLPVTFLTATAVAGGHLRAGRGPRRSQSPRSRTTSRQTVCSKAYACCTLPQLMGNGSAGTSAATATADCTTDVAPCEHACETKTAEDFRNQLSGVQRSVD